MRRIHAYGRVSTQEQARSGYGLDAQHTAVVEEAERRGWPAVCWHSEQGVPGSVAPEERPVLSVVLAHLEAGDVLAAAKLDRLARSAHAFLELAARAENEGWSLVVLDLGLDMTSPLGRFTATILAAVAELERDLIAQRVREGMAAAKAQGVHVGCPPEIPQEVAHRIVSQRQEGATLEEIADRLNSEDVPTARGGSWWPSTVSRVLQREESRGV